MKTTKTIKKEENEKVIKSIYMDVNVATFIEEEAIKQRRNFSFIANDVLTEWVAKQIKKS